MLSSTKLQAACIHVVFLMAASNMPQSVPSSSRGGWSPCDDSASKLLTEEQWNRCSIPRVKASDLSAADLAENYIELNRPVIISGLGAVSTTDEVRARFEKSELLSQLGSKHLRFVFHQLEGGVKLPQAGTLQSAIEQATQSCVPNRSRPYIFYTLGSSQKATWLQRADFAFYSYPPLLQTLAESFYAHGQIWRGSHHFSLGGLGSGVGFHQHGDAWTEVLFGYKKWLLCGPRCNSAALKDMFGSTVDELALNLRGAKDYGIQECLQGPGEVLFIPQFWHHAVVNKGEVMALTFEGAPHDKTSFI